MKENQKFPEPIITPTTKAEMGLHDEDISKEEILKQGLATPEEYEILEKYTLALFKRGTEIAAERGLILVDTKYEFGKHNGVLHSCHLHGRRVWGRSAYRYNLRHLFFALQ